MKIRVLRTISCFCMTLIAFCADSPPSPETGLDTSLVKKAPIISGYRYHSDAMVESVNGLRRLGKEKALAILKQYDRETGSAHPEEWHKLFVLCRLLFVNPQGWTPPALGHPDPEIDWSQTRQFPMFPLALSDGVPFLLVSGFTVGGYSPNTPDKCIELCEGFSLVAADLSVTNHLDAAINLVQSDKFKHLYSNTNASWETSGMVMEQANPTPVKAKEK